MADFLSVGRNLGTIFGGGGGYQAAKTAEEARLMERAAKQADTDRKVDMAIMAQQQRQAVQGVAASDLPEMDKNLIIGKLSQEWAQMQRGKLDEQKYGFHQDARDAMLRGDPNAANANLFGLTNTPQRMADVDGGQVVRNPWSTDGTVTPTNVALSQEFANSARGEASVASAGAANARQQATIDRMNSPSKYWKPSAPGKQGARARPTEAMISAYLGRVDGDGTKLPPAMVDRQAFENFWQTHPDLDAPNALEAFKVAKPRITSVPGKPPVYDWGDAVPVKKVQVDIQPGMSPEDELIARQMAARERFTGQEPAAVAEDIRQTVPHAENGAGTQVPVIGEPPIITKVPGVPEPKPGGPKPTRARAVAPVKGAKLAKNGRWYVPDPKRAGKWLIVE